MSGRTLYTIGLVVIVYALTAVQLSFAHGRVDAEWFWGGTVCDPALGSGPEMCYSYLPIGLLAALAVSIALIGGVVNLLERFDRGDGQ